MFKDSVPKSRLSDVAYTEDKAERELCCYDLIIF